MQGFLEGLRNDRLVEIYVGQARDGPYLVQQTLLQNTSEYFDELLRSQTWRRESAECTLFFPEDSVAVWASLLHWIMTRELPDSEAITGCAGPIEEFHAQLVRCWILGDKCLLPAFQDRVMTLLLDSVAESDKQCLDPETALEALTQTRPGTKLRLFVAEDLARQLKYHKTIKSRDLSEFEGIPGFTSEIVDAIGRWHESSSRVDKRLHVSYQRKSYMQAGRKRTLRKLKDIMQTEQGARALESNSAEL